MNNAIDLINKNDYYHFFLLSRCASARMGIHACRTHHVLSLIINHAPRVFLRRVHIESKNFDSNVHEILSQVWYFLLKKKDSRGSSWDAVHHDMLKVIDFIIVI